MAKREWLYELRKGKDQTQKEVADAVGITQASYCDIENGKRNPSVETAKLIAKELGFDWTLFYA